VREPGGGLPSTAGVQGICPPPQKIVDYVKSCNLVFLNNLTMGMPFLCVPLEIIPE